MTFMLVDEIEMDNWGGKVLIGCGESQRRIRRIEVNAGGRSGQ
jgi:hypothetical protein